MDQTSPALTEALRPGAIRSVFQPIVDLDSGRVVAYEALARGPEGELERPDLLFAAARQADRLPELDQLCRAAAFRGAVEHGLLAPLTVFVNVEPEVLDSAPLDDLLAIADSAPGDLRVVLEITERALAARPAELLRTVERVRELGWGVAVDDVGADSMSLAFLPLLTPDVIKLDLRLVQDRPVPAVAEIMNAVNAHSERTGAVILAEGIETEDHLATARALGATLGQGWLFGRPAPGAAPGRSTGELRLPAPQVPVGEDPSPFACLPTGTTLRRSPKSLLIELSKQLEREAMRLGETSVVAATFQEARHFTPATALRYRDLVERTGFVCAIGEGLPVEPIPGLRGATLRPEDPLRGEWDVVVLGPHFSAALLARDLGDDSPDRERTFEYGLTYDREAVVRAAHALLLRVAPQRPSVVRPATPAVPAHVRTAQPAPLPQLSDDVLRRALAATTSGISVVDLRLPDQPLVYVNEAFERLAGVRSDDVLGRNCRFLQGPDTDPRAVARLRDAIERGIPVQERVLNHRGPDRTPWWNEIHLSPVRDDAGAVVQYIGVQHDVTAQVEAERAMSQGRNRTHVAPPRLAHADPLTGLPDRRRVGERVETALWDARAGGTALAVLLVDIDAVPTINGTWGHAAGEDLICTAVDRMRARVRRADLLGRLGGHEFVVGLLGLDRATARAEACRVANDLVETVRRPIRLGDTDVPIGLRVGVAVYPEDGEDFAGLLRAADLSRYERRPATAP